MKGDAIDFALHNDTQYGTAPHGWIQWKGTNVCMDIQCACGHMGHYDGGFFYFYECSACKRRYAVGQNVKLMELPPELYETIDDGAIPTDTCV